MFSSLRETDGGEDSRFSIFDIGYPIYEILQSAPGGKEINMLRGFRVDVQCSIFDVRFSMFDFRCSIFYTPEGKEIIVPHQSLLKGWYEGRQGL